MQFWKWLTPNGNGEPTGQLKENLVEKYGSFQAFVDEFSAKSLAVFGSGWCWLLPDLSIVTTPNQDVPLEIGEPILGREAKLAALKEEAEGLGIGLSHTLAVGDGANDLAMLGEAGLGIAFRAKPAVAAAADARLDHADLTALLYAQGYTGAEIVRD